MIIWLNIEHLFYTKIVPGWLGKSGQVSIRITGSTVGDRELLLDELELLEDDRLGELDDLLEDDNLGLLDELIMLEELLEDKLLEDDNLELLELNELLEDGTVGLLELDDSSLELLDELKRIEELLRDELLKLELLEELEGSWLEDEGVKLLELGTLEEELGVRLLLEEGNIFFYSYIGIWQQHWLKSTGVAFT